MGHLFTDIPLALNQRQQMWFHHDGAPAHFSTAVRQHLACLYTLIKNANKYVLTALKKCRAYNHVEHILYLYYFFL